MGSGLILALALTWLKKEMIDPKCTKLRLKVPPGALTSAGLGSASATAGASLVAEWCLAPTPCHHDLILAGAACLCTAVAFYVAMVLFAQIIAVA